MKHTPPLDGMLVQIVHSSVTTPSRNHLFQQNVTSTYLFTWAKRGNVRSVGNYNNYNI